MTARMRAVVVALLVASALVAAAAPAEAGIQWTGCRPHWDGKTWDTTVLPTGHTAKTPHIETLCY